jgi:HD-GYP domain-containing protein (c-di-GMP phosphodiesterase class II)
MINKVESIYTDESAKFKAKSEVFRTTKEIVQSVGLPTRVIEVCQSVMDSITADVTKAKDKFSHYLTSMSSDSTLNFQYRFVELTSYLATQMVESLDEKKNIENVKTIVFCAFFCDIALKESEYLELRTEESLKDIWPEEKEAILTHALKASEIVSKYKNAPKGADTIILQHHGSLDGKGFPRVCADAVSPIAKCLIASQELAYEILKDPGKDPKVIVPELVKKFEGTPLHSYLKNFETIV